MPEPLAHAEREAAARGGAAAPPRPTSSSTSSTRPARQAVAVRPASSRWSRARRAGVQRRWRRAARRHGGAGVRSDAVAAGRRPARAPPSGASRPRISAHRGRLAGAVGPDEAGHRARAGRRTTGRRRRPCRRSACGGRVTSIMAHAEGYGRRGPAVVAPQERSWPIPARGGDVTPDHAGAMADNARRAIAADGLRTSRACALGAGRRASRRSSTPGWRRRLATTRSPVAAQPAHDRRRWPPRPRGTLHARRGDG